MARGCRIVDAASIVQDIDHLFIAYEGQQKSIGYGFVADGGVVRQFWPKTTTVESGIVWTSTADFSYDARSDTARAECSYIAATGQVLLSRLSGVNEVIYAINPPPRGQGVYLYKFEPIAGTFTQHFPDTNWHDVLEEGTLGFFENYLENSGGGVLTGQATLSFAEDDGAGAPVTGTIVSKTIDFTAETVNKTVCMTTAPWNLNNVEVNEKAEVYVSVVPDQWWDAVNEVNVDPVITGEFGYPKDIQEVEIYACRDWTSAWTVKVDQISGDPIQGATLGTALNITQRYDWYIEATTGGDIKNAVADVTITNGTESVTKRVTMRAEQQTQTTDPGSEISTDFTRTDSAFDTDSSTMGGTSPRVQIQLYVNPNGTINLSTLNGGQQAGFPQNWNTAATNVPDPQNFECRLYVRFEDDLWPDNSESSSSPTGSWYGYWFNLSSQIRYISDQLQATAAAGTVNKSGIWTLAIREVGQPDTVKYKQLQVSTQTQVV